MKRVLIIFLIISFSMVSVFIEVHAASTATSTITVTVTVPEKATTPTPPPGGGGAPGGGGITALVLEGTAYPNSLITVLKDGSVMSTFNAEQSAEFSKRFTGLTAGETTISIFAEDSQGNVSITISYTIVLLAGSTTTISGLHLPPTLSLSQARISHGDVLTIFGQTFPASEIFLFVSSDEEIVARTNASDSGLWLYQFDTNLIETGDHLARAKSVFDGGQTPFSGIKAFEVLPPGAPLGICIADLNNDNKVDIIDFSILLFNWDVPTNPASDFNTDGIVDIVDFSIMLFYWGVCPI